MKREDLVHALGSLARQQDKEEPAALAAAAEGRPAADLESAGDDQLAALLAPASPERLDAIAALCVNQMHAFPSVSVPPPSVAVAAPGTTRRRRPWRLAFVAGVALAAGVLVMSVVPSSRTGGALPAYQLEVTGGTGDTRGAGDQDPAKPITLRGGAALVLVLRPAVPVTGQVAARVFFVADGQESMWPVAAEAAPSGALRLTGVVPAPRVPAAGELLVVVGRAGDLPARAPTGPLAGDGLVLRRSILWR